MPISSTICQVKVGGSPLPQTIAALLTEATVENSQRHPDMFTLRFRDVGRTVVDQSGAKIGSEVTVAAQTSGSEPAKTLIVGEVTAIEADFDSAGSFTVIRGYDASHRLHHNRSTAAYSRATASDIVRTVCGRLGIKIGDVASTKVVYEQVSQCGETDWDFLQRLARQEGMDLGVRDGRVTMKLPEEASRAPSVGGPGQSVPLALRLGHEVLRVRAVITSAQQVKEVEVRGWDVKTKKALVATAPARTEQIVLPDIDAARLATPFGSPRYVSADVPFRSQAEVDTAAKSLAREVAGSFAAVEGVVLGNPELTANRAITLAGLGTPFDGKYTVTTTRHRFDPVSGYLTSFTVSGRNDRSFLGLATSGQGQTPVRGPAIGIVSDVNDPEGQGRVRVQLPWLDDNFVSPWARTVHVGAGPQRGSLVMPEVGDEVLVVFEQGDVNSPFVLGGLYNGKDKPPANGPPLIDSGSGAVNSRSLVSRRGHHIDLIDKDSDSGITLQTDDGKLVLTLDAAGTKVLVHSDGTILIEGKQGITLDAGQSNLDLKGNQIALSAKAGIGITTESGDIKVSTRGGNATIEGTNATVKGTAQLKLEAAAIAELKGAMVKIN